MKIDLAGGKEPREGYLSIDLYSQDKGVKADCMLLPFPVESIEAVNASHYLEHIPKRWIVPQLQEIYRVLIVGGLLDIEVPSLEWCIKNWLKDQNNGWNLDTIFGNQDDDGQFHYTGYNRQIMIRYLQAAGFTGSIVSKTVWSHEQDCLKFQTWKVIESPEILS
jgi:predicted SAM-dependent methyltransferase